MSQTREILSQSPARERESKTSAFEEPLLWVSAKLNVLGMVGIVLVMCFTCLDIFSRVLYQPVKGIFDLVQLVTGLSIAFMVPQTILAKGNVVVGLIVDLFPKRVQDTVESITLLFSVVLFGTIAAGILMDSGTALKVGEVSETLKFPMWYFKGTMGIALAVSTIVLISILLHTFQRAVKK